MRARLAAFVSVSLLVCCRQIGGAHDDLTAATDGVAAAGGAAGASSGAGGKSGADTGGASGAGGGASAGTSAAGGTGGTGATGGAAGSAGSSTSGGAAGSSGSSGSSTSGASGAGGTAGGSGGAPTCPSGMAKLPRSAALGGADLCVDFFEVSRGDWQTFQDAITGLPPGLPPKCQLATILASSPGTDPTVAVGGVTWCGAAAYCAWAGKRLCGSNATHGPAVATGHDHADPTKDEWTFACMDGAKLKLYPYGSAYVAGRCNVECNTPCSLAKPGDYPACVTTNGVHNLSGNLWEWTSICDDAVAPSQCMFRGGSYSTIDPADATCIHEYGETTVIQLRSVAEPPDADVGFRCCADAM